MFIDKLRMNTITGSTLVMGSCWFIMDGWSTFDEILVVRVYGGADTSIGCHPLTRFYVDMVAYHSQGWTMVPESVQGSHSHLFVNRVLRQTRQNSKFDNERAYAGRACHRRFIDWNTMPANRVKLTHTLKHVHLQTSTYTETWKS